MTMEWSALFLRARDALGLSQKELGELLGMDRRTIQRWEDRGGVGMDRKQAETMSEEAVKPIVMAALAATDAAGTHPSAVVAAMGERG